MTHGGGSCRARPLRRLLLVEDEAEAARSLARVARYYGWVVIHLADAETAEAMALRDLPDALLIDLHLGDGDGVELLRALRAVGFGRPAIIISGDERVQQKLRALDAGAQDYVVKGCAPRELMARLDRHLRDYDEHVRGIDRADSSVAVRAEASVCDIGGGDGREDGTASLAMVTLGPLVVDAGRHEVTLYGAGIQLRHQLFELLWLLVSRAPAMVGIEELRRRVYSGYGGPSNVHRDVCSLRRRLGAAGTWIENVRRAGYRISLPAGHPRRDPPRRARASGSFRRSS